MKTIENYIYQVMLSNHFEMAYNRNGYIFERQQTLKSANELINNGDNTTEVTFFETTPNTANKGFCIENVLGDFLSAASMGRIDHPSAVILHDDFFSNPVFMGRDIPSPLCVSIDAAKELWFSVYKLVSDTDGLSKITLNEFERFRTYHNIHISYSLSYSPTKVWVTSEPITEQKIVKNETEDYTASYKYECKNAKEIVFALLHYCISNGYVLKKCRLCGKYFIPRKAQENFCTRQFSYTNWEGIQKRYKTCKQAKKSILQTIKARKATVKDMLDERVKMNGIPFSELVCDDDINYALETYPANRDLKSFEDSVPGFESSVKGNPSIENLIAYEKYVFVDCEKYYKRYGRRGVKK